MNKKSGFSLIEILLVVAFISILTGAVVISGSVLSRNQAQKGAINTVKQVILQGATAANSRGRPIELRRVGNDLLLFDGTKQMSKNSLPASIQSNLPSGQVLSFSPNGFIEPSSYAALSPNLPISLKTSQGTYLMELSVIGDMKVRKQ